MENRDGSLRISALTADSRHYLTSALFQPRTLPTLLVVSFLLGAALTLTMLPVPIILGEAGFWDFPYGTVPGGIVDMAQTLVAYRYYELAPWTLPILNIPNLVPPAGTNLVWLDAVPLLCLFAKFIVTISGTSVNLLGIFLFFCFALPGVAMTAVFWVTGQRGLIGAIVGAALADSLPFLLFEWGHVALCAQFLIIFALLLYLLSQQHSSDWRVSIAWVAMLLITLLTSNYLFVMVGGLWFAALLQLRLSRRIRTVRFSVEALATVGIVACVARAMGILSWDLRFGGTHDFGVFSMNLGSPFVPQLSGALPPLATYWIGMRSQVFDYVGIGVLIVLVTGLPALARWARRHARSHIALIGVLGGFLLFALSNKITLGSHTLLEIPLPEQVAFALGAFRASGRFFWPIGYTIVAASTLVVLRSFRPGGALAILTVASVLQLIDTSSQRWAIAASTNHAAPAVVDRQRVADAMAESRGVKIFPTTGCVRTAVRSDDAQGRQTLRLEQATVEIQILAAHSGLPINSAITDRLQTDCTAEAAAIHKTLDPDIAYFYLTGVMPSGDQLGGFDPAQVCHLIDWVRYCLVPSRVGQLTFATPGSDDEGHVFKRGRGSNGFGANFQPPRILSAPIRPELTKRPEFDSYGTDRETSRPYFPDGAGFGRSAILFGAK
jgi:hypothetical protein